MGKALRIALPDSMKEKANSSFTPRLLQLFKKLCGLNNGTTGTRSLLLSAHKSMLADFELNPSHPLHHYIKVPPLIEYHREENLINIEFRQKSYEPILNTPSDTTHFQLVACVSYLSDYQYYDHLSQYQPKEPNINSQYVLASTSILSTSSFHDSLVIPIQLIHPQPLSSNMNLVISLSINLFYLGNGQYIPERCPSAKVIGVF